MQALRAMTIAVLALAAGATGDAAAAADVRARVQALELVVQGDRKASGPNDTATVELEHKGIALAGTILQRREGEVASSMARLKQDAQTLEAKLNDFEKATQGDAYKAAIGADNQHGLGADCRGAAALSAQLYQLAGDAQRIASQHIAAIDAIPIGQADSIPRLTKESNAIKASLDALAASQAYKDLAGVKKLAESFKAREKVGAFVAGAANAAVQAARELRIEAFTLQKLNVEFVPLLRAYGPAREEAKAELAALKPILKNPSEDHTLSNLEDKLDASYEPATKLPADGKPSAAVAAVKAYIEKGDKAISDIEKKRAPMDRERASCDAPLLAEKLEDDRTKVEKEINEAVKDLRESFAERLARIAIAEKKAQNAIDMEKATLAAINPKIAKLKAMYDATPKENTERRQKILVKVRALQKIGQRSTENILNMQLARPNLLKEAAATRQQGSQAGGALGTGLTVGH